MMNLRFFVRFSIVTLLSLLAIPAMAATGEAAAHTAGASLNLTTSALGITAVAIFVIAYILVILEDVLHLRKSKPVMVAAGLIWALVAWAYVQAGDTHTAQTLLRHSLGEFVELFLFLLAAMTYINTMQERGVFDRLRATLVGRGYSLRTIFWLTGWLSLALSGIADNLTTALLMSTVIMAVGADNKKFIAIGCVNVVVAANAGGAFSPFGDLTTLMVWQKGVVSFTEFFVLFLPSVINWIIPAIIMSLAVSRERPEPLRDTVVVKRGGVVVILLFLFTIAMAVTMHSVLHLPPVIGMTTGLGLLKLYGYYLHRVEHRELLEAQTLGVTGVTVEGLDFEDDEADNHLADTSLHPLGEDELDTDEHRSKTAAKPFNIFEQVERAEWDTLMFFYGIILCVGGLGTLGYLSVISEFMYTDLGPTKANILVGIISAIVDNVPVMFAVLNMMPEMSHGQWLLVTLTAGVGGSLLSVGSAAGVAVMGQARGIYTFMAHLKWAPVIGIGYAASIWLHFVWNAGLF